MGVLQVPVRYWAMHSSRPEDILETNVHYMTPVWEIAAAETALVLVDCWSSHAWKSHLERSGEIITDRIAPLIDAARDAGITIVHAPAPLAARVYPQWTRYADEDDLDPPEPHDDDWPSKDFRLRTGDYAQYELAPPTPVPVVPEAEDIADPIKPTADDMVIATGAQLHRLLADRKILHLLYCGFATNSCVIHRGYGMIAMRRRGYNAILVRDCTAAIENSTTVAEEAMKVYAIKDIERSAASTTSDELIAACERELQ
jgi:nicotinamidase-related amidase